MSKELEDLLRSPDSSEGFAFMTTFAAVGALVALAADAAQGHEFAAPASLAADQAQALLGPGDAAPGSSALGPPAAVDSAFVAAFAALSPIWSSAYSAVAAPLPSDAPADPAAPDPAAPDWASPEITAGVVFSAPTPFAASAPAAPFVRGDNLAVTLAAGATLTIQGQNDLVLTSSGDVLYLLPNSNVAVRGGNAKIALSSHDTLSLTGVGYQVQASGAGDSVTVQAASQATVAGDGVTARAASPDSSLTIVGSGNVVEAAAGATVTVGGGAGSAGVNSAYLQGSGVVNLLDATSLAAYGAGAAYLGANDYLALFGAFDVFAPEQTGLSTLAAFGLADTLQLQSTYADIASLLGAATEANGATTLHLNGAGDALTLTGLSKAEVAVYAASGNIRLGG